MKTTQLSVSLLALLVACAIGCGGSSKPAAAPPAPDVVAEPEPAGDTEPSEPSEPAEPPPPAPPPIALAPPPTAPGAPKAYVAKVLAFLPASARMVIGIDAARLTGTPLGQKLLTLIAGSDAPAPCKKLELAKLGNVVVGWGEDATVVVADGKMTEKMLLPCVESAAKAEGKKLTSKKIAGRTVRFTTDPENDAWLAWPKTGMTLLATTEPAVTAALDPKAAKITADVAAHTNKADHGRMVWVAGMLSNAEMSQIGMPPGTIKGGATVRAWVDLGAETDIDVVIGFDSPEEAKAFDQHLRAMIAPMAQIPDVAKMLPGLQLGVHGNELHIVAKLDQATTEQFVNELK